MGAVLSWRNEIERSGAEISTDSEVVGLGVGSLLTPQIAEVWRSAAWGATTLNLRADLGAVRTLRLIALAAPRDGVLPSAGATVRVTASAVALDGAEALDTGAVPLTMAPWGLWCHLAAADVAARWLRVRLTGTAADSYVQLGRLWAGPALVTTRAAGYGSERAAQDSGANQRAALTGARYGRRGAVYRRLSWPLPSLTAADADALVQAAAAAGTTGQVFAARVHTDCAGTGAFGHLSEIPAPRRIAHGVWSATISIDEDM